MPKRITAWTFVVIAWLSLSHPSPVAEAAPPAPGWSTAPTLPNETDYTWDVVPFGDHIYVSGARIDNTTGVTRTMVVKVRKTDGAVVTRAMETSPNTGLTTSLANTGGLSLGSDNFLYAAGLEPSAVPGLLQGFIWKVNPVTMTTAGFGGGSGRLMLADPARSYAFTRVKEYGGKIFASGFTHAIDEPAGNTDWFLAVFDRATGNLLATHTAFDTSGGDACNDEINDIHVGASGVYIVGQVLLGQCVAPVSMVQRLTVAADGTLALSGSWSTVAGVEFADGWAIDGTTSGDVYVASRVFKLVGGVAVADWRLNRLRVCTTGTLLCSTHQADAGLNDGSSYNMPRSIAVTSGSSPKLVVGGFRRDPAGRQCTLLDPAVGATCFDWHLQGWKWSSSGGFVNTWKREAFNGASDRTGMVHGIAMDPGGRYFYAVGCTNALGPHGSRGCFIASTKSEVDWHGQWQRWEISTGR